MEIYLKDRDKVDGLDMVTTMVSCLDPVLPEYNPVTPFAIHYQKIYMY